MFLLAPTDSQKLLSTALWFKNPIARKLADEKGVNFGFELKGEPETIKMSPSLYWGYHLPGEFASEWYYHPEKRHELISSVSHIAALKPAYVNLHGIHLWWEPPAKEYINRYANRSDPDEYFKILESNIELIKELKKVLSNILLTVENYPLYSNYQENGKYLPTTYLYTGTGRLDDLLYLKEKTGVDVLLDEEHMILTLNFLNRQRNYHDLPVTKVKKPNRKLLDIFGFILEKDIIPYVKEPINLETMVQKIAAKHYHVTGSVQDVLPNEKILTHEPIEVTDKVFRENLRLILRENPESILVETANPNDGSCYHYLRSNETELSFYNLCQILLEEL